MAESNDWIKYPEYHLLSSVLGMKSEKVSMLRTTRLRLATPLPTSQMSRSDREICRQLP